MENLGEQLYALIKERFGSVPKIAGQTGVPAQTIYSLIKKGVVGSSLATLAPLAQALGIDPLALTQGRIVTVDDGPHGTVEVPLLGSIAAGTPIESLEESDTFPIPAKLGVQFPRAFLLRVKGDSMDRILPDGCYALVDPCSTIDHPGQPYAVAIERDEATIKRVRKLANGIELIPDSNDQTYERQVFDFRKTSPDEVRIIGRVVWFTVPLDWSFDASLPAFSRR